MKKTEWFSIRTLPIRAGWYEGRYRNGAVDMFWFDLSMWRYSETGLDSLFGNVVTDGEKWRGLAEKPE